MNFKDFSGYILAGGKSSRMGTDKAFLQISGKTFLENAVEIFQPVCGNRIKIVLNPNQTNFIEKLPDKVPYIFDIYINRGALGGIHAGLKNCSTEFALILAVDLPFMTSDAFGKLAKTASVSKEFSAIVSKQANGRLQPLAGVYRVNDCLKKLEQILTEKADVSVYNFLTLISAKHVEQKDLSSDENLLLNVNSHADLDLQLTKNLENLS